METHITYSRCFQWTCSTHVNEQGESESPNRRWDGKHNSTIDFLSFEYIFEGTQRVVSLLEVAFDPGVVGAVLL